MSPDPDPAATFCLPISVLDDLELLRAGALGDASVGPGELVRVPAPADAAAGEQVVGTDTEGVPIARFTVRAGAHGEPEISGMPLWCGLRSARPFEAWHRDPGADQADFLIALDGPVDAAQLDAAGDSHPGRPLLLVLASTDAADEDDVRTVRAALTWASGRDAAGLAVAPLGRDASHREEKVARVLTAYAQGRLVVDLTGSGTDLQRREAARVRPVQPSGPNRQGESMTAAPITAGEAGIAGARPGCVLFFTGLSGSGKSTMARAVRNALIEQGRTVTFLDGDLVRRHLSAGLGFSAEDRDTNIRRIGWVAAEVAAHGGLAICSPIAPRDATRREIRDMVIRRGGQFMLVHVATPLAECERRDRKGLYAKARRGEIADFTGISAPYDVPADSEVSLRMDTTGRDVEELRDQVLALLDARRAPGAQEALIVEARAIDEGAPGRGWSGEQNLSPGRG